MRRHPCSAALATAVLLAGGASSALAGTISGTGGDPLTDPALTGGTQETFEAATLGSFASMTFGGLTVTGVGGSLRVQSDFAGSGNTFGSRYLDNNPSPNPYTGEWLFDFAAPVSAFAFTFGFPNSVWSLTAYSGAGGTGAVIDSTSLPVLTFNNNGEFYGLTGANIMSARLVNTGGSDWVFIDNFTYNSGVVPVPEPSTFALFGLGVAGLGAALRRRRKQQTPAARG